MTSPFSAEDRAHYRALGLWGEVTLPAMFAETAARVPDRLALVDAPNRAEVFEGAPRRLTYAQMRAEVDRLAGVLQAQGVGPGALVATQLPNIVETVILYLALSRIGAVLSPISIAYRSAELRDLAQVAAFDAYISVATLKGQPYYAERIDAPFEAVRRIAMQFELPRGAAHGPDQLGGVRGGSGPPDGQAHRQGRAGGQGRFYGIGATTGLPGYFIADSDNNRIVRYVVVMN